jgi:small-conductance mechanosensitive channel
MPEETELQSATTLAVTLSWVAGAVVAAYLLGILLSWVLSRVARRSHIVRDVEVCTRLPFRAILMVVAATIAVQRTADPAAAWRHTVDHALVIALIGTVTWLVTGLVKVVERQIITRFGGGDSGLTDADRHRRRVRTQVTVLRRLAIAVVVVLGSAAILMTFPAFSDIGTTLFASAGVLSVVAGLAAQTSLGSVFAGLQIAFSDAIRVGDVVVLEEEWGRIEEITLTYVVVRLWDERRLVLPCTYFTATPFQNWTRNATELLGTVELDVDYSVPFDDMRAELDRLLADSDLWDGRSGVLQVTDAVGGFVRVRMLVSASNAGALFDLRCAVREGLVDWIRRTQGALPVHRIERAGPPPRRHDTTGGETRRVSSTVFSGSPEADARAREFADSNGHGRG